MQIDPLFYFVTMVGNSFRLKTNFTCQCQIFGESAFESILKSIKATSKELVWIYNKVIIAMAFIIEELVHTSLVTKNLSMTVHFGASC